MSTLIFDIWLLNSDKKLNWAIALSEVSLHLLNSISSPTDSVQHFLVLLQSWPNWCERMQNGNGRAPPSEMAASDDPCRTRSTASEAKNWQMDKIFGQPRRRKGDTWSIDLSFSQISKSIWSTHPKSRAQFGTKKQSGTRAFLWRHRWFKICLLNFGTKGIILTV